MCSFISFKCWFIWERLSGCWVVVYKSLKTKEKSSWVIPKVVVITYGSLCLRELFITRFTVKIGQAYPPRFYYWIDYLKNESVSRSRNCCQIQSGISACVMSSEYFTRTSLYLVRLKIFEWIKFLRRHLHQIQENGAGRNFITASGVNSWLITHARVQRSIWNLQLPTDSTFE